MTVPSGLGRDGHLTDLGSDRLLCDPPGAPGRAALAAHAAACAPCREVLQAAAAWSRAVTAPKPPGLRRDGHLNPLSAERLAQGEESTDLHWARQHAADCAPCAKQLECLQNHDAGGAMPPHPAARATRLDRGWRARRWAGWRGLGGAVALAAVLALLIHAPKTHKPDDGLSPGLRSKGSVLTIELYAHDGARVRPIDRSSTVHVAERIGFRLQLRRSGHVLIVGADRLGHTYLCFPFTGGGQSRELAATDAPVTLEDAVEMDEVQGFERLVTLHCPTSFSFSSFEARLSSLARSTAEHDELPVLVPGCLQRETILKKTGPLAPMQGGAP